MRAEDELKKAEPRQHSFLSAPAGAREELRLAQKAELLEHLSKASEGGVRTQGAASSLAGHNN